MRWVGPFLLLSLASPSFAALPCESEYRLFLGGARDADRWKLERGWVSYATGRAESSDALLAAAARARSRSMVERPGFRELRRDLQRCIDDAPPIAVAPFSVHVFSTFRGAPHPLGHVEISIDGEVVGYTDQSGTADFIATGRLHVVTARERGGSKAVSHLVDLAQMRADPIDFDFSLDDGGSGGSYSVNFTKLTAECRPFEIDYIRNYAPATISRIDRAVIITPETNIPVSDFFAISADGHSIRLRNCEAMVERLNGFHPPYLLAVQATEVSDLRFEHFTEIWKGTYQVAVHAIRADGMLPVANEYVSIRRAGSNLELFGKSDADGHVLFHQVAPGDYFIESSGLAIARQPVRMESDAKIDLYFRPWRIEDLLLRSTAPDAPRERVDARDTQRLGFKFDANGRPVPVRYYRGSAALGDLHSVSSKSVALLQARGFRDFWSGLVLAELFDQKGRLTFRTTGAVTLFLEAPGGPVVPMGPESWFLLIELPVGSSRRLELRGWLPQMRTTFDLEELARNLSNP